MNAIKRFIARPNHNYDLGLVVLRFGFGLCMALFHGWGKISGGPERWEGVGGSMQNLGIDFFPTFFGFMAGFSEFFCAIFIILGVFFRPATALLGFTMMVAAIRHLSLPEDAPNSGFSGAAHAIEYMVLCIGLYFSGPGKYSFIRPDDERGR
ncbi:MAG: DoxX family protein [Candidatus Latescibacteria bacterium]|nr:DoxX family protein [Candidatus Latescibacterota bacterium]